MNEKKLTDEKIVKALECCISCDITQCGECPMRKDCFKNDFSGINLSLVLDLIHRLQEENKENTRLVYEMEKMLNEGWDITDKEADGWYKKGRKDSAKEIFEKIFEVLCCFTTQGKSKEYAEGFIDCLEEVDKRLQNLAKEKYSVEV